MGYLLARAGVVTLSGPLAARVPLERHVRFIADMWAHLASYVAGSMGGILIIVLTWRSRI
jgi:hypothetical protein